MLQTELETAIGLARLAGECILKHYAEGVVAEHKYGADNYREPVTAADRDASRIIVDGLAQAFPDDAILSEEEADDLEFRRSRHRVWIVDPIDGTAGFINQDGDFGVQIGLALEGSPVVGVVYLPFHGILHHAVKGGGAFMISAESAERVEVSTKSNFALMTLAVSRNHPSTRMARIIEHFGFGRTMRRGSVGLKTGLIANQMCDAYIHPSPWTKLWDTCAPQIILEEAGGCLTDLFGSAMRYDRSDVQNKNGIVASNGVAHQAIIDHLKPVLQEFGRVPA